MYPPFENSTTRIAIVCSRGSRISISGPLLILLSIQVPPLRKPFKPHWPKQLNHIKTFKIQRKKTDNSDPMFILCVKLYSGVKSKPKLERIYGSPYLQTPLQLTEFFFFFLWNRFEYIEVLHLTDPLALKLVHNAV